ncbi:hypothetical protein TNCV_3846331 [Trichonephila clavipes]|nr:hypothetical protein TNCV_3846331 [Trichonephila clavipes]
MEWKPPESRDQFHSTLNGGVSIDFRILPRVSLERGHASLKGGVHCSNGKTLNGRNPKRETQMGQAGNGETQRGKLKWAKFEKRKLGNSKYQMWKEETRRRNEHRPNVKVKNSQTRKFQTQMGKGETGRPKQAKRAMETSQECNGKRLSLQWKQAKHENEDRPNMKRAKHKTNQISIFLLFIYFYGL